VRDICEEEIGVATRLVGVVGVDASTVTVTVAVAVPLAFVAVSVYSVVAFVVIIVEPMRVLVENDPGVMATDDALLTFQEKTDVTGEAAVEGDAVNEDMVGTLAPAFTATTTCGSLSADAT
jgi:hypothetical protein